MNDDQAWDWAEAAVSKRLLQVGVDAAYLAEKYASDLEASSAAQLAAGADSIRAIVAVLDDEQIENFDTTVEQRDELAQLFEAHLN